MSDLAADEKVCPFCAETIKAAAVKCRYCGSELPVEVVESAPASGPSPASVPEQPAEPAPELEPVLVTEPEPEPELVAEPTAEPMSVRRATPGDVPEPPDRVGDDAASTGAPAVSARGARLPLVLAVLAGVLAALLFFVTIPRTNDPDVAPDGQVVSTATRSFLMEQGATMATKVLSYKADTIDKDAEAARKFMTPAMVKQYDDTIAKVRARVQKLGLTLTAKAASSALVSATEDQAKVLVFLNQTTSATGLKQKQLDQNRVLVTMTKSDGRWLISRVDAF